MAMTLFMIYQHDSVRSGVGVDGGSVFMKARVFLEVLRSEEGLEPEAEHIKRRHAGGEEANEPKKFAKRIRRDECLIQNLVLREETCPRWEPGDREDAHRHRPEGDGDALAKTAHLAHVLLAGEGVDHG